MLKGRPYIAVVYGMLLGKPYTAVIYGVLMGIPYPYSCIWYAQG